MTNSNLRNVVTNSNLRNLPSVDRLVQDARLRALADDYSRAAVVQLVRERLDDARSAALQGGAVASADALVEEVLAGARAWWSPWPERVVNATGVILHTNLGRAPLSRAASAAAAQAAIGYSNLEFDLETGMRGSRQARIGDLIARVSGAEAGIAVNNNASAALLALSALASGGEAIVSRGEAVEIGGGFRVPDVMQQSGAHLVEVGTTNRTYVRDYEAAITERTAVILKVHQSNFSISGFTHSVDLPELVELGKSAGLPVLNDLGSGCLVDTALYGLEHEPTVQESVGVGAALTMFSGDKLLGGPQAGLIAGASDYVRRVASHPLARAVRMDKLGLAALGATLTCYVREQADTELPVWRAISSPASEVKARAVAWRDAIGQGDVVKARSAIGGGSLPGQTLPSYALSISPPAGADAFTARLRQARAPVAARIEDGRVCLDPRAVGEDEDGYVLDALRSALGG